MKFIDHRAYISQSLLNKTNSAIRQGNWLNATPAGQGVSYTRYHSKSWQYEFIFGATGTACADLPIEIDPDPVSELTQDILSYVWIGPEPPARSSIGRSIDRTKSGDSSSAQAHCYIQGATSWYPKAFNFMDDDCKVLSAKMEIIAPYVGLTQTYCTGQVAHDANGNPVVTYQCNTTTSSENIGFVLCAIEGHGDRPNIVPLGSVPASGSSHTTPRISSGDATSIVQAMWDRKRDGITIGYLIIAGLAIDASADIGAMLDGMRHPNTDLLTYNANGGCSVGVYNSYTDNWTLEWDNPTISKMLVKMEYPDGREIEVVLDGDEEPTTMIDPQGRPEDVVVPRWPVLS